MGESSWATLGQIVRARGVKGELVVQPWSDKLETFTRLKEVYVGDDPPQKFEVKSARLHQGQVLLKLEGINTPEEAHSLKGNLVQIPFENLPRLPEGEFYVHQLRGMQVFSEEGILVGEIREVISNRGNDILQVVGPEKEYYVPATKEAVMRIELQTRKIFVNSKFVIEQ